MVLAPSLLGALAHSLNTNDTDSAGSALEDMIEIAEQAPRFFRKHLPDVVSAMLQIAETDSLDDSVRKLAVELLLTLFERRDQLPGLLKRLPNFVQRLFGTLLFFLLDVEDVPEWHQATEPEDEDSGHGERFEVGQECLDRMAMALGGNVVVPVAGSMLNMWIGDQDWKKRHATLICLAQIAEGCAKVMLSEVDALTDMCLKGVQDAQVKVRWAACQALGQMCTDLGPELQESQHQKILPALITVMNDNSNPRVQAHAAAVVVNFSECCEPELLEPYLEAIIGKLLQLLQHGSKVVKEGALTAMASVADCAETGFEKYYDSVMPLLRSILLGAANKDHQLLRAKALECVSLVGMAVGRDRFRPDAPELMQVLNHLHNSKLDDDDPITGYLLQAGARLCKCMGQEFLPYLHIVMPPLLKAAQQDPDVKVLPIDDDELDAIGDADDEDSETIVIGDKFVQIRTSVLEEKATACQMLRCYADELKDGFAPYVKEVTDIMVPLLKFYFHEDVRKAAVQAMPDLLQSVVVAANKSNGANMPFVKEMLDYIWPNMMQSMSKEMDLDVLTTFLDATSSIVDIVDRQLLDEQKVESCFQKFENILKASEKRRKERMKERQEQQQEEHDEYEAEALDEEDEEENEMIDEVGSCIGAFLKKFNDAVLPLLETLMPILGTLLEKTRTPAERRIGICVMIDVLEHSPAGGDKYVREVLPILMEAMREEDPDLRQCAVFGVGVVVTKFPQIFKTYVNNVIPILISILQHPSACAAGNEMATDNVVSTLGKVLQSHPDSMDGRMIAELWLHSLPIVNDTVEAKSVHAQLVAMVESGDTRVLGDSNKNLPQVIDVFVQVLGHGREVVAKDVGARMVALMNQMQGSLPAEVVQASLAKLSSKQQQAFQSWMAGSSEG
ncbi:unnamed protein product [Ostreobium quekettii]|uniref:TOG domain-containing protein n=1 Tax=Ostreobium quekettii TaxID=121088 RepID=A0A8S1IN05_9CHLO|nr:unnamed protein product [Ostreobium quekettii]|eukprot:evm.model.scf_929.7 EVM.evm.TU.scf_929.7   scf_929:39077-48583(-)